MSKTVRLFQITQLLRSRKKMTAQVLADVLEVSARTIYRDIQQLLMSGVPINGEAGTGYWLLEGFDFPPLMFTEDELEALMIGMRLTMQCVDPQLQQAALTVLNKVENSVPERFKPRMQNTAMDMHVAVLDDESAVHFKLLRKAIRAAKKLTVHYSDANDHKTCRIIRPLELSYWGKVWTLSAWCELREGFREFRVDRIIALTEGVGYFSPEVGKRLQDYYAELRNQQVLVNKITEKGTYE